MAHGNPVAVLLESSGTGPMLRRTLRSGGLVVLNYHRIGDGRDSAYDRALWSASQDELDEQLSFLRRSFTIVSPGARMLEQARDHRRSIAITFDDGYRDNYELAFPVLREHGVSACFFLATGFLDRPRLAWWDEIAWIVRTSRRRELPSDGWLPEPLTLCEDDRERQVRALLALHKTLPVEHAEEFVDWLGAAAGTGRAGAGRGEETWMTWDMAREMQAGGMVFGAHTITHPVLSRCSPARQAAEIHGSLDRVGEELGAPVALFSYPDGQRGSFDEATRACLRARDVALAFSFYGGRQPKVPDPLDVRRIGVGHDAGRALFRARATLPRLFAREIGSTGEDGTRAGTQDGGTTVGVSVGEPAQVGRASWGSSLRQGLFWSSAAFVASKALTLAAIVVLARLLAPSEFGVLAAVVAYIAVIELGSDLGMKAAIVFEQERGVSARIQTAFTLNLVLAATLSTVGVVMAPLVAGFFGVEGHTDLFRLGALNLLLAGLGNTHDALLLRDMSFSLRIRPQVVRDLTRGAVAITLAIAGLGAAALVIGYLAGTAAWCVAQTIMSPLRPRLRFDPAIARSMVGYGGASAALDVLAALATRIDVLVIGGMLGSLALGVYMIAFRLPDILIGSVAYTATVVAFPALARKRDEDRDNLAFATLQLLRYHVLYALPLGAAVAMLSVPLIDVLFSSKWQAAAPVMVPIAIVSAVRACLFPLGDTLKAVGRQGTLVRLNLLAIPVLLAACLLAQRDGITAVAWAITIVITIEGSFQARAVRRLLGLSWRQIWSAALPGVTTALGVLAASGAVRLPWSSSGITALLTGAVAGAAGGLVALRWLAPATYADLTRQLRGVLPRRHGPAIARL